MKQMKQIALALCVCLLTGCAKEKVALLTQENPSNRMEFAAGQLRTALEQHGYEVVTEVAPDQQGEMKTIYLEVSANDSLRKEGFTITTEANRTTVFGNDGSGVIYGCRELIDRMDEKGRLDCPVSYTDAPEMVLRGTCIGVQKPYYLPGRTVYEYPYTPENFPWFYDKALWIKYLDMLVANRMNSVYLWNGHPFASLVKL